MTTDQIVIIILSIIMFVSTTFSFVLVKNIDNLKSRLWQSELDKGELIQKLQQEFQKNSLPNPNDLFIKFLTDTRESAFEYIQNAQQAIIEFITVSDRVPMAKTITKEQRQNYKDAYNKLIDLLPINTTEND